MKTTALILGVGGMDGSHLAEHLLVKGYNVHGMHRRSSVDNLSRLPKAARDRITFHRGNLTDATSLERIINTVRPDELYNFADLDHIGWSWDCPMESVAVTYGAVVNILEIIRKERLHPIRFFQPISSTIFGTPTDSPQDENTPIAPRSPYAIAKAAALAACQTYRAQYDVHVCTGIFYNHDSPRRSKGYLLDTIIEKLLEYQRDSQEPLALLYPRALVDIGYAADYVRAAQLIMSLPMPDDYIVATQKCRVVTDLVQMLSELMEIPYELSEVIQGPPTQPTQFVGDGTTLVGNYDKLYQATGWTPKTDIQTLLRIKAKEAYANLAWR